MVPVDLDEGDYAHAGDDCGELHTYWLDQVQHVQVQHVQVQSRPDIRLHVRQRFCPSLLVRIWWRGI